GDVRQVAITHITADKITTGSIYMPIGWGTPSGKRAVLELMDARIAKIKERQDALIVKAGKIAVLGNDQIALGNIREDHSRLASEIRLVQELRRDVADLSNNVGEYQW